MKTLQPALLALTLGLGALGCAADEVDHRLTATMPAPPITGSDGTEPPPPAPARTLKTGTLLSTSPRNLILDPGFAPNPIGWGHWYVNYESGGELDYPLRTESASPGGVSAPIAIVKDSTATDDKSRAIRMLTPFLGGPGPYRAQVWIGATDVAGNATELRANAALVSLTTNTVTKSFDVARTETTMTIGGRNWVLFAATIPGALQGGGYFQIRLRFGGGFVVTAPQLVSEAHDPKTTAAMLGLAAERAPTPEERAGIAEYLRRPIALLGAQALATHPRFPLPPR